MAVVKHTECEETVGIAVCHLNKIAVLYAVYELLCNNGCGHLGIVHIAQESLGGILSVNHIWRQHLALLTEEQRATAVGLQLTYALVVNHRVLIKPQMTVCVDYAFFHLTNIWSPMISCTFCTSASSIGSLTYCMFLSTFFGLALLKSVVAMRGFKLVENCMASLSIG